MLQKVYEIQTSVEHTVDFTAANRQFKWLEIYFAYDNRDQHLTVYNTFNVEVITENKQKDKIENITKTHIVSNDLSLTGLIRIITICFTNNLFHFIATAAQSQR